MLTGESEDVYTFAAWYRSVIDAEQPLYLYEWADEGEELTTDITAEEIGTTIEEQDAKRMAKPES